MVLESIKINWIEKRPYIALFFGAAYTFIGYAAATLFFKESISVAMLFLATLLLVPSLIKLLEIEEDRESRYGLRHFFTTHKDIIEAYVFLFLGVLIGYVLLGFLISPESYDSVFLFQNNFLGVREKLSGNLIDAFMEKPLELSVSYVAGVVENNITVAVILFILSFFYGAGAIFLVVLNASIFASFIVFVIRYLAATPGKSLALFGFFSVHVVPEVTGFLLAAVAGGVVSKAVLTEKIFSRKFGNVLQDALLLLLFACILIVAAAFLEVYVTTYLFHTYA